MRIASRVKQISVTIRNRPVVMLARAIDAVKGLLMEEAHKTVFVGGLPQHFHYKHVVIHSKV